MKKGFLICICMILCFICGCAREHVPYTTTSSPDSSTPTPVYPQCPPGALRPISDLPEFIKPLEDQELLSVREIADGSKYPGEPLFCACPSEDDRNQYTVLLLYNPETEQGLYMELRCVIFSKKAMWKYIMGTACPTKWQRGSYFYKIESFYARNSLAQIMKENQVSSANFKSEEDLNVVEDVCYIGYMEHADPQRMIIYAVNKNLFPNAYSEILKIKQNIENRYFPE